MNIDDTTQSTILPELMKLVQNAQAPDPQQSEPDNYKHILNSIDTIVKRHQETERELEYSRDLYQTIARLLPVGIFQTDASGNGQYINKQWCDITGSSEADSKNDDWLQVIHPDDRKKVTENWNRAVKSGAKYKLEYRLIKENNDIAWVLAEAIPIKHNDTVTGYLGSITDISKLREAEELSSQRQKELEHFTRLNTAAAMTSGIAHQLNQPLSVIVQYAGGAIRRLENTDVSPAIIHALKNIIAQSERAGKITHGLKDFLQTGELQYESTNLNTLVRKVIQYSRNKISQANIKVELNLEKNLPKANVDKIQIEQVLTNIVDNAIDAMSAVITREHNLCITTQNYNEKFIAVTIQDNGVGMLEETQVKIFEPFFTTKEQQHGMGMGLAICANLIEAHNGKITLTSEPGEGARFEVLLPTSG
tara:strand:+ start:670 stop:1932 length:1263 start_codon:yes stop_codon:yes gene_type:complete